MATLIDPAGTPLICCVKTGTKFADVYVTRLRDGVARHLDAPHRFVCLTERPVAGVDCEPLPAALPGWWAKIGLFKLGKPLLYFDLDVIIVGDLGPLLDWSGVGIIKDWWLPGFNSSVMRLTGAEGHIWEQFATDPALVMRRCRYGDQQWVTEQMPEAATFPQAWFRSWKADHLCEYSRPPAGAMAVVFHGMPRPHQITAGWVPEYWR